LSELATMGIGNKPCLDIKPSSDNIQDRYINIAVGNREGENQYDIIILELCEGNCLINTTCITLLHICY